MPSYYPAFIDVRGRECVVFGGGPLGEEKAVKLLECGARVKVIASEVEDEVANLADAGKLEWVKRDYRSGDLASAFIAISAAEDDFTDRRIHAEAERRNVLLNVVDVTHLCTFIAPSVARRGEVTVATSTGGASPALARTFREKLEASRILEFAESGSDAGKGAGGTAPPKPARPPRRLAILHHGRPAGYRPARRRRGGVQEVAGWVDGGGGSDLTQRREGAKAQ